MSAYSSYFGARASRETCASTMIALAALGVQLAQVESRASSAATIVQSSGQNHATASQIPSIPFSSTAVSYDVPDEAFFVSSSDVANASRRMLTEEEGKELAMRISEPPRELSLAVRQSIARAKAVQLQRSTK